MGNFTNKLLFIVTSAHGEILVRLIPGLNDIEETETGAVNRTGWRGGNKGDNGWRGEDTIESTNPPTDCSVFFDISGCPTPQKITTYSLSANRQRPLAGTLRAAFFNTFRRSKNQALYVVPPFVIAYAAMNWAIERYAT